MTRPAKVMLWIGVALLLLFPAGLLLGSVALSPAEVWNALSGDSADGIGSFIVVGTRLPALCTAILAGAALAVAGLMMQTCFSNPLAGPSIMGISTGASLGVALVVMFFGGAVGLWGRLAVAGGAFAGAMGVLLLLLFFSSFVRSSDALLIVGILIGYMASSAISMLNYFTTSQAVHTFVLWGLGTFNGVDAGSLPLFAALVGTLLICAMAYAKSLNVLLFGIDYARAAGMEVSRVRTGVLLVSGALTAVVTAYCGPIGFIGLVVPHIARILSGTSNHRTLLPATALAGALTGLLCQMISVAPAFSYGGMLPVNAITPVVGVPVILYVLLNRGKLHYFN